MADLIEQTEDLTLVTDGERRYGKVLFEICHELLRTVKVGRPRKTLKKGVVVRVKNKGTQAHKKGRKKPKYQTTCPLHPETSNDISDSEIHVNHVEANNSAMRRKFSPFTIKTNIYSKSKNNLQHYVRTHFTTKEVPVVRLGIIEKALNVKTLFSIQYV